MVFSHFDWPWAAPAVSRRIVTYASYMTSMSFYRVRLAACQQGPDPCFDVMSGGRPHWKVVGGQSDRCERVSLPPRLSGPSFAEVRDSDLADSIGARQQALDALRMNAVNRSVPDDRQHFRNRVLVGRKIDDSR